jgi:hypothetical protein
MKESRKKVILGIFIIFIMVSSGIGLFYGGTQDTGESFKYKGLKIISTQNGWIVKGDGLKVTSLFNPESIEDLDVERFPYEDVNSAGKIYISFNPNENLRVLLNEVNNVLIPGGINVQPVAACNVDVEGCENLPLKTCEDSAGAFVLEIKENEDVEEALVLDNCVKLEGSGIWMAQALDKMVFLNHYGE